MPELCCVFLPDVVPVSAPARPRMSPRSRPSFFFAEVVCGLLLPDREFAMFMMSVRLMFWLLVLPELVFLPPVVLPVFTLTPERLDSSAIRSSLSLVLACAAACAACACAAACAACFFFADAIAVSSAGAAMHISFIIWDEDMPDCLARDAVAAWVFSWDP